MGSVILLVVAVTWVAIVGTVIADIVAIETAGLPRRRRSIFQRFIDAVIESRQRKAQIVIDRYRALVRPRPVDPKTDIVHEERARPDAPARKTAAT